MGTIGVTRCLGDHDLYVFDSDICIKPFLSPKPEVGPTYAVIIQPSKFVSNKYCPILTIYEPVLEILILQ